MCEVLEGPREWLGAKARCPSCDASFVIESPAPVARRSDPAGRLRGCGIGAGFVLGGLGGMVAGFEVARRETAGKKGMMVGFKESVEYGCAGLLIGSLALAVLGGLLGALVGRALKRDDE